MFCPKCGASLDDGAQFCPQCGAELARRTTAEQPSFTNPVLDMRVDAFLKQNSKYFRQEDIPTISQALRASDPATMSYVENLRFKSPGLARILSIFPFTGMYGFDRFYAGGKRNVIVGLIKLFTGGGFLIVWLFDLINMGTNVRIDNLCRVFGVERNLKDSVAGMVEYAKSPEGRAAISKFKESGRALHDNITHDI